ncbi:hypothetical protein HDK77DRAFT_513682 [Phyllosticta capitalensis]|uniref:uncharacterized protein n=1 Tax=Phyllosticta capitalensis TaxID=121624 RepID=UPI00312D6096
MDAEPSQAPRLHERSHGQCVTSLLREHSSANPTPKQDCDLSPFSTLPLHASTFSWTPQSSASLSLTASDTWSTMAPASKKPRFINANGFDLKLMGVDGATKLMKMVAKEPEKFRAVRSMYLGVAVEGLDDFADDMLASALNMLSPGNVSPPCVIPNYLLTAFQVPHNLQTFKLFIAGGDYMEMHSKSVCTPCASHETLKDWHFEELFGPDPPESLVNSLLNLKGLVYYQAERAFIRALLNIRGIEHVEIEGPMPAELKKRICACLTTRPGCKVRNWNSEESGLRTEKDISFSKWTASMQSHDDPLDDTVGPDGVELADTTALHHGLEVSYTVEMPVPKSPLPHEDRTIWNKPPFKYPSPETGDGSNFNPASIRFVEVPEDQRSSSPENPEDVKDEDFDPNPSRKRRSTKRAPREPTPKRHCTRSTKVLFAAVLDSYDAKRAIGFPPSPPGKLRRVNYLEPDIEEDFGKGDDGDPSKRMSWFRGDKQSKKKQWVLPTSRAAKISVATKVDRDGRRQMRENRKRQATLQGIPEEDVDDDALNSSASEGEEDGPKAPDDGPSPVKKEIPDSDDEVEGGGEAQGSDVDMAEYYGDDEMMPPSSSPPANDEDDADYDDYMGL